MIALVSKVVLAADMGGSWRCLLWCRTLVLQAVLIVTVRVSVRMVVAMVMPSELGVAHRHQLQEKHDEGSHESDRLGPWVGVGRDGLANETRVTESLICRSEQVDEGCSNNNSRAEVLGNKKGPSRYELGLRTFNECREDGTS